MNGKGHIEISQLRETIKDRERTIGKLRLSYQRLLEENRQLREENKKLKEGNK